MSDAAEETGDCLEDQAYATIIDNLWQDTDRFPLLEAEWPRIAQAIPLFLAGDNTRLQEVCDALADFFECTGRWEEWLTLSVGAEARALAAGDYESAGTRAHQAAWIHSRRGEAAGVIACARRAVEHWTTAGLSDHDLATAMRLCGDGHFMQQDYPAAIAAYQETVELWRGHEYGISGVATALTDLASAEQANGDYAAAEAHYREAITILRVIADPRDADHVGDLAAVTGDLANLCLAREDWANAEALAREALPLSESIHGEELIAWNCGVLAEALLRQNRAAEALPHARRAVELFQKFSSPELEEAQTTLAECEAGVAVA